MPFELARCINRRVCFPPRGSSNAHSAQTPDFSFQDSLHMSGSLYICSSCFRLKVWKRQGNMHRALTFEVSSINVDSWLSQLSCYRLQVTTRRPQISLPIGSDIWVWSPQISLQRAQAKPNQKWRQWAGSQFKVFAHVPPIRTQVGALSFQHAAVVLHRVCVNQAHEHLVFWQCVGRHLCFKIPL